MNTEEKPDRIAETLYADMRSQRDSLYVAQREYGKWMINTLYLMHAGAIVGLISKVQAGGPVPAYVYSIAWFIFGIVLAFAAAFSTWWNFTFAAEMYDKNADVHLLTDRQYWPKYEGITRVAVTMWIAIALGLMSLGCLVVGAVLTICWLR